MTLYADVAIVYAASQSTPCRCSIQLAPHPDPVVATGCLFVGAFRSATISAASPPSSAATTKPTPTSPTLPLFNDRANAKAHAARTNLSWVTMLAERKRPGRRSHRTRPDRPTKAQTAAAAHGHADIGPRATEALQHLA